MARAKPAQQIFNLVQRLNGSGGIVDGRRERPYRDIHQKPQRVLRILIKGALAL
jgi:hypothetical protein